MRSFRWFPIIVITLIIASPAQAHFLFIRILPPAEGGRSAEVYFSEYAEAGDPTFIRKIEHTQLWLQSAPGKFQPLKVTAAADRLRAYLPAPGSLAVIGTCEYGVIARAKKTPFLLRHYPKALAGQPEELNRLKTFEKIPLEITALFESERITFTALRDGKPLAGAVFDTVAADLTGEKLTAGDDGKVTWKPAKPGRYSIYTSQFTKATGEAGGKRYEEVRAFATLSFTWPTASKEADAKAVAMFQEALAARASWKDFPGFTAHLDGKVDGRPITGKVTVDADGNVDVDSEEMAVKPWVVEQLESIVLHRGGGRGRASGDAAKPVLRFADPEEDHPFGRLLIFDGGRFASSYRVKDRQILVVNRHIGKSVMTITVLHNERNADSLFLPHSYTVQYWDAATGALSRTEAVQQRWRRVGSWDLPALHTVTTASETGLSVRSLTLSKHALLK